MDRRTSSHAPPRLHWLPTQADPLLWERAFQCWLQSQPSPHTRRAYRCTWESFQSFTAKMPWEITKADVATWLDSLRLSGLATATLHQRQAALSSFYQYVTRTFTTLSVSGQEQPLHHFNPALAVPRPPRPAFQSASCLSAGEARALLRAIPRHTFQGKRDYALFLCYLATGRRNSEIRQLRWSDFEPNNPPSPVLGEGSGVRVNKSMVRSEGAAESAVYYRWQGKGRSRRDQCPSPVWQAILDFLAASGKLRSIQPSDFIFTPLSDRAVRLPNVPAESWTQNRPLSMREVGRLLKKYARQAGLDAARVHVHTLRHTAAMLRRQAGDDLEQVSAFLGHSSLAITQIYLHRLEGRQDSSWPRVESLLGLS